MKSARHLGEWVGPKPGATGNYYAVRDYWGPAGLGQRLFPVGAIPRVASGRELYLILLFYPRFFSS